MSDELSPVARAEKTYNYFLQYEITDPFWINVLRRDPPIPPTLITEHLSRDNNEENWIDVDGGSQADDGFSVYALDNGKFLNIKSDTYEETACIPIEKVPLLLDAIRLVLEKRT